MKTEMPRTSGAFRGPDEGLNWSRETADGAEGPSQEPLLNYKCWWDVEKLEDPSLHPLDR